MTDDNSDGKRLDPPPLLSGTIALFVAALAAIGLTGDVLTRAVRNFPVPISSLLIVTLFAALGLLVLQYGRTTRTSGRVDTLRKRYLTILVVAVSVTVALPVRSA